jgi:DNA-binding MarR family transcriptional regulator
MNAAWRTEIPDIALDHFLLGAGLMRIGQLIEKDLFEQARDMFGIGAAELGLLLALRRQGPPYMARPRALSRMLLITSGAVTKQIDRVESKDLVARAPDPDSLNGQLISLTEGGLALTERAVRYLNQHSLASRLFERVPKDVLGHGEMCLRALLNAYDALPKASARPEE